MIGASDWVGEAIRAGQRRLTPHGDPSLWSHTFILGEMRPDRRGPHQTTSRSPYLFESDLQIPPLRAQFRNGAQENCIGKWCGDDIEHAAILDFGLSRAEEDAVLGTALQLCDEQVQYPLLELVGTWLAIVTKRVWGLNPFDDPHAMYCSAFVRYCFRQAGRDFLGREIALSNTALMLIIISDLHFTDGTSGETIRAGAFRVFRERLRDLAYDACWRSNGLYKPIEELHLVLLGDILDVIRSTRWLTENGAPVSVRPWDDPQSQAFIAKVRSINDEILKRNADSFAVLKSLDDGRTTTISPATAEGKPAQVGREPGAPNRQPVKVHIHYLVGNHDWFYHLPATPYNTIRQSVVQAMGLANPSDIPFPHDPMESDVISRIYEEHRVLGRHGDIFDQFNYEQDRNASSLGDAIVIELLNRFPGEVERQIGAELPRDCISGLKEIDNVRPLLIVPVWIEGLLRRTCPDPSVAKKVKQIWDILADDPPGV